ncbi:MAG: hypothetical protein ABI604_19715, partial [Nitrospirota bacterium]
KNRVTGSNTAQVAIEHLEVLTNHEFLEKARRASFQFNYSIYSWHVRSNTFGEGLDHIGMFTFGITKELSAFEFPEVSNYIELFRSYQVIHTQWTPLKIRLTSAGTAVSSGMFLALAYFWLFFQESTKSGSSNRDGTIFTAVRRTRFSRVLFFAFLAIPPTVVGLLMRVSYRVSEAPEFLNTSNPVLDTILAVGVVIMSALIWRAAQIEWKRITAHAN